MHMVHSEMVPWLQHIASGSVTAIPATMFLQAVCRKWPRSFAVAACTQLAVNYMDDVSLTEEVLLEPAKLALMVERGPVDTPSQQEGPWGTPRHQQGVQGGPAGTPRHWQGVHGGIPQVHASALPLSMSERQLSFPRPEPCSQGLCVQTRWALLFTHTHTAEEVFLDNNDCNNERDSCNNHDCRKSTSHRVGDVAISKSINQCQASHSQ